MAARKRRKRDPHWEEKLRHRLELLALIASAFGILLSIYTNRLRALDHHVIEVSIDSLEVHRRTAK